MLTIDAEEPGTEVWTISNLWVVKATIREVRYYQDGTIRYWGHVGNEYAEINNKYLYTEEKYAKEELEVLKREHRSWRIAQLREEIKEEKKYLAEQKELLRGLLEAEERDD